MSVQASRLPTRFPVGTRYVIEGRDGRIDLRYLEFPDGRHVDLSPDVSESGPGSSVSQRRSRRPASGRKF